VADLSGRIQYTGLNSYISCGYACAHGITPSVVSLVMPAVPGETLQLEAVSDLKLTDGERDFTLVKVRITGLQRQRSNDGITYHVSAQDRRWTWQFGHISGEYNKRDQSARIIPASRKTVHELAQLCLKAMGEEDGSWDINALPDPDEDEALPEINWEWLNPAQCLAQICDQFACRIVYRPIDDTVLIATPGEGEDLPEGSYSETSPARETPPKPETLRFVGAPASFVMPIVLEAVGEELNGKVIPLNDLSYKPTGGWDKTGPPTFANLRLDPKFGAKGKTLNDCKAAAQKSVYRWYRVTIEPADGSDEFTVPGLDAFVGADGDAVEIADADQIIPLDRIIGSERDEEKHLWIDAPKAYGKHFINGEKNSERDAPVKAQFSIDPERRLVMFNAYVAKINLDPTPLPPIFGKIIDALRSQTLGPAEIVLLTSIQVRDKASRQPVRYIRDRTVAGGEPDTVQVVRRDDVQFAQFVHYKVLDWSVLDQSDNTDEVEAAADKYLDPFDDYDFRLAESRTYPRLVLIDPDGAIQSVTWECGGRVSTAVARNTERVRYLPPYIARRGAERARVLIDIANLVNSIAVRTANVPLG